MKVQSGEIFALTGAYIDQILYGVYIALTDLEIDTSIRSIKDGSKYIDGLVQSGKIVRLNIREIEIAME